jgi:transcriptional regulator with XRE-family HTH domain
MPRPNQRRTIASETNLARRIAFEREYRELSYEALANLMTDAGCSMAGSAIYRIEKGDPPRRVTVDELVAFSKVFSLSIDDLLTPIELVEQQRAKELIDELDSVTDLLVETTSRIANMYLEYYTLAATNPELYEYVDSHWEAKAQGDFPVVTLNDADGNPTDDTRFHELASAYSDALRDLASTFIGELAQMTGHIVIDQIGGDK